MELFGTIDFPSEYTAAYENGDYSGMDDDQIEVFKAWMDDMLRRHPTGFTLNFMDEHPEFCYFPAFGKGGECITAEVWV